MNYKFIYSTLFYGISALTMMSYSIVNAQSQNNSYSCINYNGSPTTVVDTIRGRIQLIAWESNFFKSSGWTPLKRCQEVTARLQRFSDAGLLIKITTGVMNNYNVICIGEQQLDDTIACQKDGLILTLQSTVDNPNGDDPPEKVLKDIFVNATKTGNRPVTRGKKPQTVIDIPSILETAPLIETETTSETQPQETNQPILQPQQINLNQNDLSDVKCEPLLCK